MGEKMEEIEEQQKATEVQLQMPVDEFVGMIDFFNDVLLHIRTAKPEALYRENENGIVLIPKAVIDIFQEAVELEKQGLLDLDNVSA